MYWAKSCHLILPYTAFCNRTRSLGFVSDERHDNRSKFFPVSASVNLAVFINITVLISPAHARNDFRIHPRVSPENCCWLSPDRLIYPKLFSPLIAEQFFHLTSGAKESFLWFERGNIFYAQRLGVSRFADSCTRLGLSFTPTCQPAIEILTNQNEGFLYCVIQDLVPVLRISGKRERSHGRWATEFMGIFAKKKRK